MAPLKPAFGVQSNTTGQNLVAPPLAASSPDCSDPDGTVDQGFRCQKDIKKAPIVNIGAFKFGREIGLG
jgi:hypothetical protein